MHVLKFGGTSMGDEHTWRKVLQIIEGYRNRSPIIVVSATARTTRKLVAAAELALSDYGQANSIALKIEERHRLLVKNFMAHFDHEATGPIFGKCDDWIKRCITTLQEHLTEISETGELKPETKDAIASIGEQLSSRLFAYCGSVFGLATEWIDARDIIKTDSDFGNANPDTSLIQKASNGISNQLQENKIPVMGGYYGEDSRGNVTTLGFEGSDFSASLIGAALGAESIEIWTDVSGIYTCDPRVVKDAYPIGKLSFQEATEMAYFGAKVLHPSTMNPAEEKQLPILVKNIFEPDHPGTVIQGETTADGPVKAMTFLRDVVILTVTSPHTRMGYDFLSGVFRVLKDYHLSVNVVTTTEASVSVALAEQKISQKLVKSLQELGVVEKKEEQGIVSLIGCNFDNMEVIENSVLSAISEVEVSMISYSRAKRNLNIVLPGARLIPSVKAIHQKLFR